MTTPAFLDLVDLASERLGGSAIACNDEFFAPKENLINPAPAIWREDAYTERGKWMDGWETRRRRDAGGGSLADAHDWCVIRLGARGRVRGVDVDTSFFKGNYPEACALDVADDPGGSAWREILPRTPLAGDSHNRFPIADAPPAAFVRLRMYPDGGVARLRIHGEVVADWPQLARQGDVDLAAAEHGGLVVACSDMFFGSRHNLIMPGDARNMGDGWETKRRRAPGHDWSIVRLGHRGTIRRVFVDTRHFKGNAPGACSLDAVQIDAAPGSIDDLERAPWQELLPRSPLEPHTRHTFEDNVRAIGVVTHVRFNIFPDGGVGRLRVFGRPDVA